jgi:diguanylate cyclase (GGDEF)-like protein
MLPEPDGSIWLGTEAGLFRGQRRGPGMAFKPVAGTNGIPVHSVERAPNGDVWIGTETRGAARIVPGGPVRWIGTKEGLTGRAPYSLRFDHAGQLWAATEVGLFVARAPYSSFSRIAQVPATRIWTVAEGADGSLWAGGADGLFRFAAGRWANFTRSNGLSNQEVLALGTGPDDSIWVGYRFGGGIDRVHSTSGGIAIQKGVQRPGTTGLIYFLNFDSRGQLWAGTEHGVEMWDGSRWRRYDTSDGLVWDDCDLHAFAEAPDGALWFGTSGGVSRFQPRHGDAPDPPLQVVFTSLRVGSRDVSALQAPSFGGHANSLAARYSAPNALHLADVIFRYRLSGASSAWTETTQRELQFANLAPGAYRLEVGARERDGTWSDSNAQFSFEILTPWNRSWWFFGLCALLPFTAAAGMLRWRMAAARRRELELIRVVEARTADLRTANEELLRLSLTDPLTGLANRRVLDQTLDRECARLTRKRSAVSLLMIDVDHFKALNDAEGHQRGDEYLISLGAELNRLCKRQMDLAARCGGEEFAVVLADTDAEAAAEFAEAIRLSIAALNLPHPTSPVAPFLTVSVGVATATQECLAKREELVGAADRALYAAKRAGRNCVSVARPEVSSA